MQPPAFGDQSAAFRRKFPDLYDPPAPRKDWADAVVAFLFSVQGRVSRHTFRRARLGFLLTYGFLYLVIQQTGTDARAMAAHGPGAPGIPYVLSELGTVILAFGLVFWCAFAVTIKRWHDLDRSGWWALLGFIPLLGLIGQTVMFSVSKGTRGPNRYGPAPR